MSLHSLARGASATLLLLAGCHDAVGVGPLRGVLVLPPMVEAPVPVGVAGGAPTPPPGSQGGDQAPPVPSGHGGGGTPGGPPVPSGPFVEGHVVGVKAGVEAPLAGATIRTSDGRTARSDALGVFRIPGTWPSDGGLVAARDGYVASAVVGLDDAAPPTLHLKARGTRDTGAPAVLERLPATGRVVGPDGLPREGLTVVFESAGGAFSAPTVTDADGRFSLVVFAPGGRVTDGTVLAIGDAVHPWAGMATAVSLDAQSPELDLDAAAAGLSPLTAIAAAHAVRLNLNAAAAGAPVTESLDVEGPGASLSLPLELGVATVADLPGATYALRADAVNAALGTTSRLVTAPLAIDFTTPTSTVDATMLAPPELTDDANLSRGQTIRWNPVAGAVAYTTELAGLDAQGFLWEGFTTATTARFDYDVALGPGNYGLTLTAWDAANLTARSVASVGPARLRVLPGARTHRRSSRQIRRSIS